MALNLRITETPLEQRFLDYLEKEKPDREKWVRKLTDILINDDLISFELSNKHIRELRKSRSGDPFEELLLALFLADAEEWEESIAIFGEVLLKDFSKPIAEDIRQIILLIKISELKYVPTAGELTTLLESISSEKNIVHVLWKLNELMDAGKNPELFFSCIDKAKELYPQAFRISNFQAWLFVKENRIEPAVNAFLTVLDGLQKEDPGEPNVQIETATVWLNLAECHLMLPVPDHAKAIEYCNTAYEQGEITGDLMMEILILLTRAKAYLMPDDIPEENRQSALADINRILEIDPQNKEALKLKEKANKKG
jgi:tetratricopeptide (TPR) repeat protein